MGWDRPGPGECLCGRPHPCPSHGPWTGVHVQHPAHVPQAEGFTADQETSLRAVGWALMRAMADDRHEREADREVA